MEKETRQRTDQQNKALHKWYALLSEELNDSGLEMRKVLKPEIEIRWTPNNIKEYLWRPIQILSVGKKSTKDLTTKEIDLVWNTLNRFLGEKLGVHVPFPSLEEMALEELETKPQ